MKLSSSSDFMFKRETEKPKVVHFTPSYTKAFCKFHPKLYSVFGNFFSSELRKLACHPGERGVLHNIFFRYGDVPSENVSIF